MKGMNMLILIEGVDKIGKSTLAEKIADYLHLLGYCPYILNEMKTILGVGVKLALKDQSIHKGTKLAMVRQLRSLWVDKMIANLIYNDTIVIMDRFVLSTMVYQDVGCHAGTDEYDLFFKYAFPRKMMTLLLTANNTDLIKNKLDANDSIEQDLSKNIEKYQQKFIKSFEFLKSRTMCKNMHHIKLDNDYAELIDIIPHINKFLKKEVKND